MCSHPAEGCLGSGDDNFVPDSKYLETPSPSSDLESLETACSREHFKSAEHELEQIDSPPTLTADSRSKPLEFEPLTMCPTSCSIAENSESCSVAEIISEADRRREACEQASNDCPKDGKPTELLDVVSLVSTTLEDGNCFVDIRAQPPYNCITSELLSAQGNESTPKPHSNNAADTKDENASELHGKVEIGTDSEFPSHEDKEVQCERLHELAQDVYSSTVAAMNATLQGKEMLIANCHRSLEHHKKRLSEQSASMRNLTGELSALKEKHKMCDSKIAHLNRVLVEKDTVLLQLKTGSENDLLHMAERTKAFESMVVEQMRQKDAQQHEIELLQMRVELLSEQMSESPNHLFQPDSLFKKPRFAAQATPSSDTFGLRPAADLLQVGTGRSTNGALPAKAIAGTTGPKRTHTGHEARGNNNDIVEDIDDEWSDPRFVKQVEDTMQVWDAM